MKTLLIIILLIVLPGCVTPRPWTKAEKIMLGASCLAVVADAYTTMDGQDHGHRETHPVMGKHPSDGTIISVMAITQIATVIVAHYWEGFRAWILGTKTGVNAGFAFHNMRTAKD